MFILNSHYIIVKCIIKKIRINKILLTVFRENCFVFLASNIENCVMNDDEYSVSNLSGFVGNSLETGGNITNVSLRPNNQSVLNKIHYNIYIYYDKI